MNPKKNIVYLFLGIFMIIVIYNFVLPFFTLQTSYGMRMGMGMGMHGGEWISNNNVYYYNLILNFILIVSIVFVGFIIVNKVLFSSNKHKCKKCGLPIESDEWKICPRCGQNLQDKGGNNG
ncbi:hypothetical protein [Neobacillus sp. LXY-4]|uniref:hypothetical protein n=1 Tax=Neobacillus sp. LXY-4 TaxID=3379826 RepID=UPI003EE1C472